MEYYIDGHNLIPKISGIRLSDENDETELLERVQEYARLSGHKCTVFFDKAPENKTREQHYGSVRAVYVTHLIKADEEIIAPSGRCPRDDFRDLRGKDDEYFFRRRRQKIAIRK